MLYKGPTKEYLQLENIHSNNCYRPKENLENPLTLLWLSSDDTQIIIDDIIYTFNKNQILSLTEFHKVDISGVCNAKMIRFNRPFYCIIDHDSEIGCKGILFFGASQLPIINIPTVELEKFETIWRMFELEMEDRDGLQLEMLQSMLKRFIIMCTRLYKIQANYMATDNGSLDVIREFNWLVEQHFKTKFTVGEYASLLNKSPKTLSNLFAKISDKTPLQYIQERRMLEAQRLLRHSELTIKEVAYELGFDDLQTFGRFFKNYEGLSPTDFKKYKQSIE